MANFKVKGILSYPYLFQPRASEEGGDPKFGALVLIRKDDPQLAGVQALVAQEKAAGFPTGFPAKGKCFLKDCAVEFPDDPRMANYMAVSGSAQLASRPAVVDGNLQPILDPSQVCAGMIVWGAFNSFVFKKTTNSGVSAGLNGIMSTGDMGELGRLDGRPSVESMFAGASAIIAAAPAAQPSPAPAAAAPLQVAPNAAFMAAPAPAAHVPKRVMTAKAGNFTYEQYMATPGWTEQMLIDQGFMVIQ